MIVCCRELEAFLFPPFSLFLPGYEQFFMNPVNQHYEFGSIPGENLPNLNMAPDFLLPILFNLNLGNPPAGTRHKNFVYFLDYSRVLFVSVLGIPDCFGYFFYNPLTHGVPDY
jgi:hypothetical protein